MKRKEGDASVTKDNKKVNRKNDMKILDKGP